MSAIFISHASHDESLAEALCSYLADTVGISSFFCSSYGSPFKSGLNDLAQVMDQIDEAKIFIELITQTFMKRPQCLIEVGYATARERMHTQSPAVVSKITFMPIVVPPLGHRDVNNDLHRRSAYSGGSAKELGEFVNVLRSEVDKAEIRNVPEAWERKRKAFVRQWLTALQNLHAQAPEPHILQAIARVKNRLAGRAHGRVGGPYPALDDRVDCLGVAKAGQLEESVLLFLYEASCYDGESFLDYPPLLRDNPISGDVLERFLRSRFARPAYKVAFAMQYWTDATLKSSLAKINRSGLSSDQVKLLDAIASRTVSQVISTATDLDDHKRSDLQNQFDEYAAVHGAPPSSPVV